MASGSFLSQVKGFAEDHLEEDNVKPKLPEEDEFEKSVAAVRLWELAGNAKMWLLVAFFFSVPQAMLGPFIGQTFGNIINTVSMPPVVWLDDTWGPCSRGDSS